MSEDLKFPVKYAVLELKREGGYSTNYEDVTEGFIVSKCYVLESKVRYMRDGNTRVSYKVYFPYNYIESYAYYADHRLEGVFNFPYSERRKDIGIDACGEYYPVEVVSDVFDTYTDAKAVAESENERLESEVCIYHSILDPDFEKIYEKERKKLAKKLEICRLYEQFITENTRDLEVTKDIDMEVGIKLERKKKDN